MRRRLLERLEQRIEGMRRRACALRRSGRSCSGCASARTARCRAARACHRPWCARRHRLRSDRRCGPHRSRGSWRTPRRASALTPRSQFRHLARMRATVVLPTPRVPANRNAWCMPAAGRAHCSAHAARAPGRSFRRSCADAICAPVRCRLIDAQVAAAAGGDPHQLELRHPTEPLPLLPSGPDGVHGKSSRRNRRGSPWTCGGEGGIRTHEHP